MDNNKLSPMKTQPDPEEPYPSLSDYHDYEPNLEFDDTELLQAPNEMDNGELLIDFMENESNGMGSPVSDFTDENYDELLNGPASFSFGTDTYPEVGGVSFSDIAKYGIVDVKGDDADGRKVIVVYACKLPPTNMIDHNCLLEYLKGTLDLYVEQDYSLIYFHYGLTSKNKPSIAWLWQAYKAFDRKYKKNLKALYVVHPTSFLKIISQVFRPVISVKFGKKLNYIHSLKELSEHIKLEQLAIPEEIKEFDRKTTGKNNTTDVDSKGIEPIESTRQFGVTLQFIKKHYNEDIPPVVKECVKYLDKPDALETEGLFRRSANLTKVKQLAREANKGSPLTFESPHEAGALLKKFLRELKEPILTQELYDEVIQFQYSSKEEQLRQASILVMEKLPEDNYKLLKFVVSFLSRVMERADLNKMTAQNLAVVFGPNLIWSDSVSMCLSAIMPINYFTQFLLQHHKDIFIV
ncbi:rho GTPase-activating protein 1 [Onthophagus taurus]|uniref:rho GTPase-activating protein 1 n=1 Tax=Onthophagus taurus TaxID=166361 RepID=UPI000C20F27C|nr:rho GTPase-activating protein 1 [Onthophagus taurus]